MSKYQKYLPKWDETQMQFTPFLLSTEENEKGKRIYPKLVQMEFQLQAYYIKGHMLVQTSQWLKL